MVSCLIQPSLPFALPITTGGGPRAGPGVARQGGVGERGDSAGGRRADVHHGRHARAHRRRRTRQEPQGGARTATQPTRCDLKGLAGKEAMLKFRSLECFCIKYALRKEKGILDGD